MILPRAIYKENCKTKYLRLFTHFPNFITKKSYNCGLQGENGDLDIKNLKQNIQKCRSQILGNFRRNFVALCKTATKSFRSKRVISQLCKILPSTWSDLLTMAVTPSFQLRIAYCLKHWIVDFLSFEMTYNMHKHYYKNNLWCHF